MHGADISRTSIGWGRKLVGLCARTGSAPFLPPVPTSAPRGNCDYRRPERLTKSDRNSGWIKIAAMAIGAVLQGPSHRRSDRQEASRRIVRRPTGSPGSWQTTRTSARFPVHPDAKACSERRTRLGVHGCSTAPASRRSRIARLRLSREARRWWDFASARGSPDCESAVTARLPRARRKAVRGAGGSVFRALRRTPAAWQGATGPGGPGSGAAQNTAGLDL
jgi:hypothetical protein